MNDLYEKFTRHIRCTARRLLSDGSAERVIGFEPSDLPGRATPLVARTPEEADRFVWHSGCVDNLATFIKNQPGRVGVVARGCDTRAIVTLIQEKQLERDRVFIIGVPCPGTFDFHTLERALDFEEIAEIEETPERVTVRTATGREASMERDSALWAGCATCEYPTPLINDELIGDPASPRGRECDTAEVDRIEALAPADRWKDFEANLSACIRCYACRNACPMCYCATCFVDRASPQWLGTTPEPADAQLYHLVRALHLAGRCVDCGACNRACPEGIDLRRLNKKLEKEAREMFGHVPGVDVEATPVMSTYDANDPQDFILE